MKSAEECVYNGFLLGMKITEQLNGVDIDSTVEKPEFFDHLVDIANGEITPVGSDTELRAQMPDVMNIEQKSKREGMR